ncbi:tetratricopeptide repeat protein [bacterium]|nr:tetratricopeptide repeat protein [bacterium]
MEDKNDTVAALLNNFGSLCRTLGDAKAATQYLEKALEILLTVYGPDHPSTKTVQANIDVLKGNG